MYIHKDTDSKEMKKKKKIPQKTSQTKHNKCMQYGHSKRYGTKIFVSMEKCPDH